MAFEIVDLVTGKKRVVSAARGYALLRRPDGLPCRVINNAAGGFSRVTRLPGGVDSRVHAYPESLVTSMGGLTYRSRHPVSIRIWPNQGA